MRGFLSSELQQIRDDVSATTRFRLDDVQVLLERTVVIQLAQRQLRVAENAGEGVFDLVCDASAKLPERGELFLLNKRRIGSREFYLTFAKLVRHLVERMRERTDFVTRAGSQGYIEIAFADLLGGFGKMLKRF